MSQPCVTSNTDYLKGNNFMQTTYWCTNDQLALVLCVNNMQLLQCDVHLQLESYPECWLTQTSGVTASFVLLTGYRTEEASWMSRLTSEKKSFIHPSMHCIYTCYRFFEIKLIRVGQFLVENCRIARHLSVPGGQSLDFFIFESLCS